MRFPRKMKLSQKIQKKYKRRVVEMKKIKENEQMNEWKEGGKFKKTLSDSLWIIVHRAQERTRGWSKGKGGK